MQNEYGIAPSRRLGFMGPLLLFVLLFVAGCGVMACVFLRAAAVSTRAESYNAAVSLCRSEAECWRAGQLRGQSETEPLYFDRELAPANADNAASCLWIAQSVEPTAAGQLQTAVITACTPAGEEIYRIEAQAYGPQGE